MPTTTTAVETLKVNLTKAVPDELPDALRQVDLGNLLTVKEYDTGTITASATVALPEEALMVQSARIVTSGTAGSVGSYLVSDSSATLAIPTGGASLAPGVAKIGTDNKTITFPNTVTRAVIRYVPGSKTALATKFAP